MDLNACSGEVPLFESFPVVETYKSFPEVDWAFPASRGNAEQSIPAMVGYSAQGRFSDFAESPGAEPPPTTWMETRFSPPLFCVSRTQPPPNKTKNIVLLRAKLICCLLTFILRPISIRLFHWATVSQLTIFQTNISARTKIPAKPESRDLFLFLKPHFQFHLDRTLIFRPGPLDNIAGSRYILIRIRHRQCHDAG